MEGDDDPDEGTLSSLKEDEEEADVDTPTLSCVFSSARMPDAQLGRNTASVEVPKIIFAPQSVPPLLASQSLFVNPAAFSATSAAQESLPASSQSVNPSTFSSVGRFSFSSQPAASMFSFGQPEVAAKESSAPPSLLQSQSVKASPLFPAGIPSFSAASVSKAEVPKLNTKPEFPPPPPQAQTVSPGLFSFSNQSAKNLFSFKPEVSKEITVPGSLPPPSLSQSVQPSTIFSGMLSFSTASSGEKSVSETLPPPSLSLSQSVKPGLFSHPLSSMGTFSFSTDKPELPKEKTGQETLSQPPLLPSMQPNTSSERLSFTTASMSETQKIPGFMPLPSSLFSSLQPRTVSSGMLSFSTASSGQSEAPNIFGSMPPPPIFSSLQPNTGVLSLPTAGSSGKSESPKLPGSMPLPPLFNSVQPSTISSGMFTSIAASSSMSQEKSEPESLPLPPVSLSQLAKPGPFALGMLSASVDEPKHDLAGQESQPPLSQSGTSARASLSTASSEVSNEVSVPESLPPPLVSQSVQPSAFSSAGMLSFSDLMSKSSSNTTGFGKASGLEFQGTGNQLFTSKQDAEVEGSDNPEEEADVDFKPIVTLPDTYDQKSWDDNADTLFAHRCKLFRYDAGSKQWKERGVGDMKIMKHRTSGKVRLIMRRDQILKICCNHYISKEMKLVPGNSEKSWIWFTHSDYSDETPKEEKLAVRFKHVETASEFRRVFDECVCEAQQAQAVTDVEREDKPLPSRSAVDNWECEGCYTFNNSDINTCVACKAPKPDYSGEAPTELRQVDEECVSDDQQAQAVTDVEREDKPLPSRSAVDNWECEGCYTFNNSDINTCVACKAPKPDYSGEAPTELRQVDEECVSDNQQAQAVTDVEREDKPLPSRSAVDNWECEGCYTFNNSDINTCVACKAPKSDYSGEAPTELRQVDEECVSDDQQAQAVTDVEREDKPLPSRSAVDNWECEGCYTFNNSDINTCAACKAPKPDYSGEAPTELRQVDEECVSEDQEDADSSAIETIEESHVVEVSDTAETSEPVNIPLQFPLASSLGGDHSLQLPINRDQHSPVSSLQLPLVKEAGIELVPSLPLEGTSPSDNEDVLTSEDVSDSADASDGESVIFLYEELPSSELITKAEKFMLPPSFYLCENKSPCPGCRGCEETDNSDGKKDVVDMSNTNSAPQSSSPPPPSQSQPLKTSDLESQSAAGSVVSEVPKEKSESLPPPLSVSQTVQSSAFSSAGMVSFSDLLSSNTTGFGKAKGFTFQGAGSQLFASKQDAEVEGSDNPEEEADVDFKPIVTLPDTYDQKSWDDNADTLFAHRCKLFRYDAGSKQWKERGVGDMKIMKHRTSGKVRLIMRRDQILKICCNHYISKEMKLVPGNSEKSWIWFTHSDYSDETPKEEKLAMRFKHVETASEFRRVFDECVCEAQQAQAVTDVEREDKPLPSRSAVDNWECEGCYTFNNSDINTCVACKAPKPDYSGEAPTELRQVDEECVSEDQEDADSFAIETFEESHVVEVSDAAETSEPVNIPLQFPLASSLDGDHSLQLPINRDQHSPVSSLQLPLVKEAGIELVPSLPLEGTSPSDNEDVLTSEDDSADASDGESVIFLYEELPSSELIAKAEKFMLPPSFYLCENKSPCPGCRGCEETDNSDGKKDVVDMSNTNSAPQSSSPPPPSQSQPLKTSDLESQSAAGSVVSEVPKEKSESLPPPLSVSQTVQASAFSSAGMVSFSDLLSSNTTGFGKAKGFTFQGAGSQLFASKQDAEVEGSDNPEEEADVDFKPIVTLPDTYDQKSWDDNADTLFAHRCKLFRYDAGSKQWKERGVGDMKIMKHRTSGKVRLIMRRDQILKICCNHYISKEMKLVPGNSEKSWIWFTHSDYSDETPKEEKLAVRFKHVETASEFRRVFDECVCEAQQAQAVTDVEREDKPLPSRSAVDNWECEGCYTFNNSDINTCVACKAPKPDCSGEAPTELRQVDEECVSEDQEAQALTDVEREDKPLL